MEVSEPSGRYLISRAFRRTEAGVLPTDWAVATIGETSKTSSGTTPPRSMFDRYFRNGQVPWVKTLDLNNSEIQTTDEQVTLAALAETSLQIYPKGSVLVAMYGGYNQIGRTGLLRIDAAVNQALTAIRPDSRKLCSGYLLCVLNYRVDYWKSVASSSRKDPNITGKDVASFPLAVPSLVEQEAIAEALSDADALIESLKQLLAKKRHLKQGAMQELLTGKKRLPGFSGEWEVKRLGQVGLFTKGRGVTKNQALSGTLACVRYGEIYTRHNEYIKSFHSWISRDVAATAVQLRRGDLLFAGSGETKEEIGKCIAFISDIEAYAGGDIVIFRQAAADPLFLGYYLNTLSINRQKANRGQGDAVVHISSAALSDVECTLPSLPEQAAIASIVRDMDTELADLDAKLTKARQIKQGMMQALLTGKTRLI